MTGVIGNVGGCGGVTGGTGGGTSRSLICVARGGVGGKCGRARLAQRYLTTHPGTPCFDSWLELYEEVDIAVFSMQLTPSQLPVRRSHATGAGNPRAL